MKLNYKSIYYDTTIIMNLLFILLYGLGLSSTMGSFYGGEVLSVRNIITVKLIICIGEIILIMLINIIAGHYRKKLGIIPHQEIKNNILFRTNTVFNKQTLIKQIIYLLKYTVIELIILIIIYGIFYVNNELYDNVLLKIVYFINSLKPAIDYIIPTGVIFSELGILYYLTHQYIRGYFIKAYTLLFKNKYYGNSKGKRITTLDNIIESPFANKKNLIHEFINEYKRIESLEGAFREKITIITSMIFIQAYKKERKYVDNIREFINQLHTEEMENEEREVLNIAETALQFLLGEVHEEKAGDFLTRSVSYEYKSIYELMIVVMIWEMLNNEKMVITSAIIEYVASKAMTYYKKQEIESAKYPYNILKLFRNEIKIINKEIEMKMRKQKIFEIYPSLFTQFSCYRNNIERKIILTK